MIEPQSFATHTADAIANSQLMNVMNVTKTSYLRHV